MENSKEHKNKAFKLTPGQQRAVDVRDSNVLVAAAAGSGKTKVLVDRILGKVTDPEHPVNVDEFLVVTFTNAAAAQMREKIREKLKEALRLLSKRYEILRTSFKYEKISEPKQVIYAERTPELEVIESREEECDRIAQRDIKRGVDLEKDTLLRVKSVKTGEGKGKLIFTIHHIIIDGWCMGILTEKLFDYYFRLKGGKTPEEIEKEIEKERSSIGEYSEYVTWLEKQENEKAKKYWEEELKGYENDCRIRAAKKPEATEDQMRELYRGISEKSTEKLKKIAEEKESTLNAAAEAAVGIMLQKYSGSNDVVFGKVVSGRNAPINGIEEMVGLFINTIPVRVTVEKETTVGELIKKQQKKKLPFVQEKKGTKVHFLQLISQL